MRDNRALFAAETPANCAVGIPEDCAKGCEQPTPVLPGVEEAKRGRFAYLDYRSGNLYRALLGISTSANMEA